MKKILLLLFLFTILPFAYGQDGNVSTQRVRTADPSTCSPSNGGLFFNTTAGAGKNCIATNTWGTQSYLNKVQTWLKAQTFQPDTDATALTLKCFNGTNTASVFLVKDKNDAALFSVDCTGAASFGGTPAVTGTPGTLPTVNTGEGQFGIGSDGEFVVKRVVSGTTQAAQKPAYQPDGDCTSGQHVVGVDVVTGKLKCSADSSSASSCTSGTPASPDAAGSDGQCQYDSSYFYTYAAGAWKRAAWDVSWLATVATPTYSPDGGTNLANDASVTITDATSGATVKYCTDTANSCSPSSGSTYSSAVTVSAAGATNYLRSYATKAGMTDSTVKSASYTYQVATPTASPAAGAVANPTTVTFSTTTTGSTTFHYTTDGSTTPTCSTGTTGSSYSVTSAVTLKVVGCKANYADSGVLTSAYTISSGGGTAPTLVQSASASLVDTDGATPLQITLNSVVQSANRSLWACVFHNENVSTLTGTPVTDSAGDTWTIAFTPKWFNTNGNGTCWYALNPTAGTHTITLPVAASKLRQGVMWEMNGTPVSSPVDVVSAGDSNDGTGTPATGVAITPTANSMVVSILRGAWNNSWYTAATGWTDLAGTEAADSSSFKTWYQTAPGGSVTPTITVGHEGAPWNVISFSIKGN